MINLNTIIFWLIFLYFFIPKFDLFYIPGSLTGFRMQDVISFLVFLLVFNGRVSKNNLLVLFALIIHSFYSFYFWNNNLSLLGVIRFLEYYAVALGIYHLALSGLFNRFLTYILIYLGTISLFQFFMVIPNFDPGRGLIFSQEFAGSFGTPAELSYFLISALFLLNIINERVAKRSFFSLLVLFNGVVAPILGFSLIFWNYLKRMNFLFGFIIFTCLIAALISMRDIFLTGIEFLNLVIDNIITTNASFEDIKSGGNLDIESDTLSARLGKWTASLSLLYQYPLGLFFGFGVYSQGGALDGGILRFLYEFGFLWLILLTYIIKRLSTIYLLILLSLNLFFDAYMSSVVMPLLIATFLILKDKKNKIEIKHV